MKHIKTITLRPNKDVSYNINIPLVKEVISLRRKGCSMHTIAGMTGLQLRHVKRILVANKVD